MFFSVQNSLIQMCNCPAERNIKVKYLCQFICCLLCIGISPCLEWSNLSAFFVQCHISMHHCTDSDRTNLLECNPICLFYNFSQRVIAVTHSCMNFRKAICPDIIYKRVLPVMYSDSKYIALIINQHSFDSC